MPSPRKGEKKKDFVSRCMSDEEAKRDFPESKQRVAFCNSKFEQSKGQLAELINEVIEELEDEDYTGEDTAGVGTGPGL